MSARHDRAITASRCVLPLVTISLAALGLAGCGSAASDGSALAGEARPPAYAGRITLGSVPPGAHCVLVNTADGSRLAEVATPAEVPLVRGTAVIEARCGAAGHAEVRAALRPVRDFAPGVHHPQPIGTGAVRNAIAVRTGSTRRYEDMTVHLPPANFPTAEARDGWFAARAAALRAAAASWIARAERAPNATIDTAETFRAHLAEDLAALEGLRAATGVSPQAGGRPSGM